MNRDETKRIIEIITRAYPRMKIVETKEDVDLWHECLEDLEYQMARQAAINLVKQIKGFPPDIATLREEYERLSAIEKRESGEIRRFYEQARNYYPNCGDVGYGWIDFHERAKTKEDAERLQNLIISYVNTTQDDVIDFVECIRKVHRVNGKVVVG